MKIARLHTCTRKNWLYAVVPFAKLIRWIVGYSRAKAIPADKAKTIYISLEKRGNETILTDQNKHLSYSVVPVENNFPADRAVINTEDASFTTLHAENYEYRCVIKSSLQLPDQMVWVDVDYKGSKGPTQRLSQSFSKSVRDQMRSTYGLDIVGVEATIIWSKKLSCKDCYELQEATVRR